MNKIKISKGKYFYFLLIIFIASAFNYFSGFRGIFPIDSFLIFDAGYKVLNDFHPFRDYWSITGPFLDYIQYLVFKIFGVSWASFVLHATLINVFLTTVTFNFFSKLGINKNFSLLYSVSIAILGYPSVGTPFMDHHASILSLISLMALILALKNNNNFYWFVAPLLLGFSFFSKQIPSTYLSFLFLFIILSYLVILKFKQKTFLVFILYSLISFSAFVLFVVFINDIPIKNIIMQYIFYPMSIGEVRSDTLKFDIKNSILQFKFIYFSLIPSLVASFYLIKIKKKNYKNKVDIIILSSFFFSIFLFIYSQLMTKNQILIFFLIPFCAGMGHYFIINYFNNQKLIYFLIFIIIISTVKFHLRFNMDKKFMELNNIDINLAIDGKEIHPKFSGLKWITPNYPKNPMKEVSLLKNTKEEIDMENKKKIIISDYQFLPYILNLKHFAPNKWFDNLSVPNKQSPFFEKYKVFFTKKLKEQNVKIIFIVGKNKINYLDKIFIENCFTKEDLNEITFKLDISNC